MKILKKYLHFNKRVHQLNEHIFNKYFKDLPILIDTDLGVILGNSVREHYRDDDEIECYMYDFNDYNIYGINYLFKKFENSINSCFNETDYQDLRVLLINILNPQQTFETLGLFSDEDLIDVETVITPENYIEPPSYNFEKSKSSNNSLAESEMYYENLFSSD